MYKLTNWYFSTYKNRCYAWGNVSGHHRLSDGTFIHTSKVESVSADEENASLLVDTKSGSHYRLLFADIDLNKMETTRDSLLQLKVSVEFLSRCETLYADSEAEKLTDVDGILNKNELLLEMFGESAHRAYYKDGSGRIHKIGIYKHLGMYQDSVLITDWDSGLVDFRYFPNDCIKPYHWSDGLKAVRIKNSSRDDVTFTGSHREIICRSGEITVIGASFHDI